VQLIILSSIQAGFSINFLLQESDAQAHRMSSNDNQPPDLASILRTLTALQNQHPVQPSIQSTQTQPHIAPPAQVQLSQQYAHVAQAQGTPIQQPWQQHGQPNSENSVHPQANPAKVLIDPATIIDWSSGLKCVMRTIAKHESMLQDIRKVSSPGVSAII
jgi:hypothetical protein